MSTPILAPNSSWFRPNNTSITRSIITEINIVDTYTVTGNEIDSWDASAANDGSVMCYVNGTKLTIAGNGYGKVFANADSSSAFANFTEVSAIQNAGLLDTSNVTNMQIMFAGCSLLTSVDVSSWSTGNVTDMGGLFQQCSSLKDLDVSEWDVSKVGTSEGSYGMYGMFHSCSSLESIGDVSNWQTGNVNSMAAMFQDCSSLKSLDLGKWDVSKVGSAMYGMNSMFYLCSSLESVGDLSNWNLSACADISSMFSRCSSLEYIGNISNWNTGNITTMSCTFQGCGKIMELDLSNWNISSCANTSYMFNLCTSLKTLNISNWDISNVTDFKKMFSNTQPTIIGIEKLASIIPTLAPNSTWFAPSVSTITRSTITEIELVNSYTPTGNETDSWDASVAKDGRVMAYVVGTKLTIAGNGIGAIFANADSSNVFNGFGTLKAIVNGNIINTSNATTFERMFQACFDLESVDVSTWNTTKVTSLKAMFQGATSIGGLDVSNWETGNVTDMNSMFNMPSDYINENLTSLDVSNWNTQNVENMTALFQQCTSLKELDMSNWNVGKVTTMQAMFLGCSSLKSIGNTGNWNTSLCENMGGMFYGCTSLETLDVSNWETTSATSMSTMFQGCSSLKALDVSGWDVSKVKNFTRMFCGRITQNASMILKELDVSKWNTSSAEDMKQMFYGCSALTTLDLSGFDTSKVTNMKEMFLNCSKLEKVTLGTNFSFDGNGNITASENIAVLPTPSAEHIPGADGKWHSIPDYAEYEPSAVPSKTAGTYVAVVKATLAPNSTWFSQGGTDITRSSITEIEIVDSYTPTGNETASWDASVLKDSSVMVYVNGTKLTIAGCGIGKIYANMDSSNIFNGFTAMTAFIGTNIFNTINATTLEKAFYDCMTLTALDLNSWDTKNVESLYSTFNGMLALESINVKDWNTGKVNTMRATFYCCSKLTELDLTGWTTNKVTTMRSMFAGNVTMSLTKIIGIENWNTSSVTNMQTMFQLCRYLEELNLSNWNVGKVTNMQAIFTVCEALTSIGDIGNWNTSLCENMTGMFSQCYSLKTLNLSGFDTSKVTVMRSIFNKCTKLEKITLGENFAWVGTDGYLPTPSSDHVIDADGYWHTGDGSVYSSTSIPSNTANTYYAYPRANKNYIIDGVLLTDLSRAIRKKANISEKLTTDEMIEAINNLSITASSDADGNVVLNIAGFSVSKMNENITIS